MTKVGHEPGGASLHRFKPYPAYKDSGVEWLGEIPAHWDARRLKFASIAIMGQSPPSEDYNVLGDGLPFLQGNADFGTEHPDPRVFCPIALKTVRPGDHLVSVRAPVGALNTADQHYGIGRGLCAVRICPPLVDNRFARWCLAVASVGLNAIAVGSTYEAVSADDVSGLVIPVPEADEQGAIAGFLDRETGRIDGLVAKNERLIELLQEKRAALIARAVTNGLDPSVAMKDSDVEWLGQIPAHWKIHELRRLTRRGTTITYGIVQAGPDIEDGVPYIRTSDMAGDSLPKTGYQKTSPQIDAAYRRSKVSAGDLVIAIRATVGKALPVPEYLDGANLTQGTAKVSPGEGLLTRYLLAALQSLSVQQRFEALSKGATFREITLHMLRRVAIPVPSLGEQAEIVRLLDTNGTRIDALVTKVREAVERLKELRAALISAAVTGKIDVRAA